MALTDLTPQKVVLASGVTLHYVRAGQGAEDKARPVVIFIHGAMGDWRAWGPQWEEFTARYDCITYSRRYSYPNVNQMPSPDHGAFVDAQDLLGFMDALNIDKAILVGSSYGAFTALAAASIAPLRVAALAGVEPPMMRYAEMNDEGARIAEEFRVSTILPSRAAFARGDDAAGATILTAGISAGRVRKSPPPPSVMKTRLQNVKAARMLALSSDEFPLIKPADLQALPMPILLMSGAKTAPVHAAIFKGIAPYLPQAEILYVQGSGHSVSREQPEVFNAAVSLFLKGVLSDC